MTRQELQRILTEHSKWLDVKGGTRADLQGANLRNVNLQGADLQDADLQDANLRYADLRGADLRCAKLQGAKLQDAYLQGANLQGAKLRNADLRDADLRRAKLQNADLQRALLQRALLQDADLQDADLRGAALGDAKLQGAKLPDCDFLPPCKFLAYKKVREGAVLELEVDRAHAVCSLVGRKCRASSVRVLQAVSGKVPADGVFHSIHDPSFTYQIGLTAKAPLDPDIRVECTSGIHFFLTREEAEAYI